MTIMVTDPMKHSDLMKNDDAFDTGIVNYLPDYVTTLDVKYHEQLRHVEFVSSGLLLVFRWVQISNRRLRRSVSEQSL